MDKPNVLKSSPFYMNQGDILYLLFVDESGDTPVFTLNSESDELNPPTAPVAKDATSITSSSFVANWNFTENATEYFLDVATDSAFTSLVAGYDNKSVGNVTSASVVGLTDAYTYYYRIRGGNYNGVGDNSNTITTTTTVTAVVDADGNSYTYVTIGTQQWLVENLKTTKYADGTAIPNLTLNAEWAVEDGSIGHDGAFCWYNNDIVNKTPYGALYNWYAVDNAHGLAPTGWRVPSDGDWANLLTYIGGETSGSSLKEQGITHWLTPNIGATNAYGFTAIASGVRTYTGVFGTINSRCNFQTQEEYDVNRGYDRYLTYDVIDILRSTELKGTGMSVRCMRDLP